MLVIGNNCCGGYFYLLNNKQFNNPFVWSVIDADDFIYLIQNYENINFKNIDFTELDINRFKSHIELTRKIKNKKHIMGLNIDNKITVYYTHYLYDKNMNKPTKVDIDILYSKNYEYVYKKYIDRINRIPKNESPVFFIITYQKHNWTQQKLDKLLKTNIKYKIIIITQYKIQNKSNNMYIIKDNLKEGDPNKITKKYFTTIQNFIQNN